MPKSSKPVVIWLLTGCFLISCMVIIGGITRLTQSGLSMVEWHLIDGTVPPTTDEAWIAEFEKYKAFPEYQELNYSYTVEDFKQIFWWEYIHRLLGRLIGVVFIVPFIIFILQKRITGTWIAKLSILLGLGGFLGFLGWYMVKSGLIHEPHVSHYRLAMHLTTAFITFGVAWWFAIDLFFPKRNASNNPILTRIVGGLLVTVILQVIYGAFVAGLKAGKVYNSFPTMDGEFMPDAVTYMDPVWLNFVEGLAGVQFMHRMIAYLVAGLAVTLWVMVRKYRLTYSTRLAVNGLLLIVVIQFVLGVLTLLNAVPVHLGVIHQFGALATFAVTLLTFHRLKYAGVRLPNGEPVLAAG